MKKWSESLVQTALSDELVEQVIEEGGDSIGKEIVEGLRSEVEAKADITALRKVVRSIQKAVSAECRDELKREIAEIAEDFTWRKSDRGRYVAEINDWVQGFHSQMRQDPRFEDLYVGGHAEMEVVYLVGKAKTQQDLEDFVRLIERNDPPRKILLNARVGE